MFVNCSNHPSVKWPEAQKCAAEKYGSIIDVTFPAVACDLSDSQLEELAETTFRKITEYKPDAVMCIGEFVVCFRIVEKLKAAKIKVLASCSERQAVEHTEEDGSVRKETMFTFRGFREY